MEVLNGMHRETPTLLPSTPAQEVIMKTLTPTPKSVFVTSATLLVAFAIVLFIGASNGSSGPEVPSEPTVNPYVHVESSKQAPRNQEGHSPSYNGTVARNVASR